MAWNDLTRYVITNYAGLMTPQEFQGYRTAIRREKIEYSSNPAMQRMLQKVLVSEDPQVIALLADGDEAFLDRVRDRIIREHPDQVFLNYCPRCGIIARTPRAKLCVKCYFEWREK